MGHILDYECSASGQPVSGAGNPPTNTPCPKCGRSVKTVQDETGTGVYEVHSKMAATEGRREKRRQAQL
jgi:hypothetical protein